MNEAKMLNLFVKNKTIKKLFTGRSGGKKPVLVVKYGPPASGKGSPPTRKAIESLGVRYDKMIHFNVDDVIESLEQFKGASRQQLKTTFEYLTNNSLPPNKMMKKLETNLNKIGKDQIDDFSKIYFNTRNTPINNKGTKVGQLMDDMMSKAMVMGLDISMETTGSFSFPDWLFSDPKLQPYIDKYQVVFVFPTVKCSTAWRRYKRRPIESYMRDGPFRFGSTKVGFANQYIKSYKAFIKNMPNLMVEKDVSYIVIGKSPTARIYNNSPALGRLLDFVKDAKKFLKSADSR